MKVFQYFSVAMIMIIATSFILPAATYAEKLQDQIEDVQNNREQLQEDIEEARNQREELRDETIEKRCTIATTRIDTVTSRYAEGTLRYVNRYNNLIERLNNVVNRLNEEEIDTADLSGYVQEITTLTTQFNNEMNQTIVSLEQTKALACGESEGEYLDLLQKARSELLQARSTAIQINNIFLTDIVNELRDIRASI